MQATCAGQGCSQSDRKITWDLLDQTIRQEAHGPFAKTLKNSLLGAPGKCESGGRYLARPATSTAIINDSIDSAISTSNMTEGHTLWLFDTIRFDLIMILVGTSGRLNFGGDQRHLRVVPLVD